MRNGSAPGGGAVTAGPASSGRDDLMQGELPETTFPADAKRWISIYTELLAMHSELAERLAAADTAAGVEGSGPDRMAWCQGEIARCRRRLAFWRRRHWELAGLDFDRPERVVRHWGQSISLTEREAQLLEFFLAHPDRSWKSETLAALAWHDSRLASEQVRTYVARLRSKIQATGAPVDIQSQPRRGYSIAYNTRALEPGLVGTRA